MRWLAHETSVFLLAVQFLTRAPLPAEIGFTPERLAAAPRYYPAVGVLVGLFGAAVFWLADFLFPQVLAALISTAATLLATGAFHEDGLADAADGLGGGLTRDRALEIMRDSRIGTYGACALGLALAIKIAALAAAPASAVPLLLIAGHGLSRFSTVVAIASSRYVRDAGTGKPTAEGASAAGLVIAAATAAAILAGLAALGPWQAAAAGALGLALGHGAMRLTYEKKLGGYTGDCLGGVQQTSEIGFLLGALAWLCI